MTYKLSFIITVHALYMGRFYVHLVFGYDFTLK